MRRTIVKLLNLVYIAAAAFAVYSVCTKPILRTSVTLTATADDIGEKLEPLLNQAAEESRSYNLREEEPKKKEISDYITAEAIADAFRKHGNLELPVEISIPASVAFDIKNKNLINELVLDNIYKTVDTALDKIIPPLQTFIFTITEEFAVDALKQAIDAQIEKFLGEGNEIAIEQVEEIYNNIFEVLNQHEPVPIEDLTGIIVGTDEGTDASALTILNSNPYRLCNPQPNEDDVNSDLEKYFIRDEEGNYVNPTEYSPDATYYVSKVYTQEDIDRVDVQQKMTDALDEVPGLVATEFEEATPTAEEFAATIQSHHYFVYTGSKYVNAQTFDEETVYYNRKYILCEGSDLDKVEANPVRYYFVDENGLYVKSPIYDSSRTYYKTADVDGYELAEHQPTAEEFANDLYSIKYYTESDNIYTPAKSYNSATKYYVYKTTVNDIDSALTVLINSYLLGKGEEGGESRSRSVTRSDIMAYSKSQAELRAAVKEFVLKVIPTEQIEQLNAQFGTYVPFAFLGIIALIAFPWGWFAFITIIRTMRRKKCWAKPRVVFILAFPELLFGFILTYGVRRLLPFLAGKIEIVNKISQYLSFDLETSCFVPSIIYLGMLAFTIIYAIFANPLKIEYRQEKRLARLEKKRRRKEMYYY